jgi:hypothetical protein
MPLRASRASKIAPCKKSRIRVEDDGSFIEKVFRG